MLLHFMFLIKFPPCALCSPWLKHRLPLLTCDRKIHQLTGVPGLHPIW